MWPAFLWPDINMGFGATALTRLGYRRTYVRKLIIITTTVSQAIYYKF